MRNIDKIKQMSVDEMAELLADNSTEYCDCCLAEGFCAEAKIGLCRDALREWLLQECE